MGKHIIPFDQIDKLPAHLRDLQGSSVDDWESGQVAGFPVLSIKGKVFHIVRGDEQELITRPDDPDEAATSLHLVVVKTHKGVARTFYADAYVEGSAEKPDCYSNDGIKPAQDAEDPQSRSCATCPHAQWGSRITDNNKKGKACSEVKRLAVAEPGAEDDPMLLRVPPTSLRNWDDYVKKLGRRNVNPSMVVTKVWFDSSVAHQMLMFKPVGYVTDEMAAAIAEVRDGDVVDAIIGKGPAIPMDGSVNGADDGAAPGPKERKRASRRDMDDDDDQPRQRRRTQEADDDDDDDQPRQRRRTQEADDDDMPPRRRRRTQEAADEDDGAPRRRRAAVQEEDDEPAPRRRRRTTTAEAKAPAKKPADDDLDLDLDLDEEDEEEKRPAAKQAKVIEGDGDLEDELNGMLADLDFDDD